MGAARSRRIQQQRLDAAAKRPEPAPAATGIAALQRAAGNEAVQRMLTRYAARPVQEPAAADVVVQRVRYASTTEGAGTVDVTESGNTISAAGRLKGTVEDDEFRPGGDVFVAISGTLKWKVDPSDPGTVLIDSVYAHPKRTAVGPLLVHHLATRALAKGIASIGTDLSAPEPGTPEFYVKVGFMWHSRKFGKEGWADEVDRLIVAERQAGKFGSAQAPDPEKVDKRRLYLLYSGQTRSPTERIVRHSELAWREYWKRRG